MRKTPLTGEEKWITVMRMKRGRLRTSVKLTLKGKKQGEGLGKAPQLGYRNRSEFIMEGIRQRIIDLKKAEIFKGEANR